MELEFIQKLSKQSNTKIVLLVMDGIGGLPVKPYGLTELETAYKPNLDKLASEGICGLHAPVKAGITPGSGPGHLSLFGYDPIKYQVGRGVLTANGINFDLHPSDIAARGNFCTVDNDGKITDRRAGRISTEKNMELCQLLKEIKIPNVEVFVETEKEHRFLLVFRGDNLSEDVIDTDPQEVGKYPLKPTTFSSESNNTTDIISRFIDQAKKILAGHHPANMVILRGFAKKPNWPNLKEIYNMRCAAIAAYPMYRGLAKLIGMNVLETGQKIEDEFTTLEENWNDFDFFYLHIKPTDSRGEDGDFDKKVKIIEEVDLQIPRLRKLNPDVIVVTGDHSTPAKLAAHSWHPVPTLLWSNCCRTDTVKKFGERDCMTGGLGANFPGVDIMPLALANAKRLEKFGA